MSVISFAPQLNLKVMLDGYDVSHWGWRGTCSKALDTVDAVALQTPYLAGHEQLIWPGREVTVYQSWDTIVGDPIFKGWILPEWENDDIWVNIKCLGHLGRLNGTRIFQGDRLGFDDAPENVTLAGRTTMDAIAQIIQAIPGQPLDISQLVGSVPQSYITPEVETDLGSGWKTGGDRVRLLLGIMRDNSPAPNPPLRYHLREWNGRAYCEKSPLLDGTRLQATLRYEGDVIKPIIRRRHDMANRAIVELPEGRYFEYLDSAFQAVHGGMDMVSQNTGLRYPDEGLERTYGDVSRKKTEVSVFEIVTFGDLYHLVPGWSIYFEADEVNRTGYHIVTSVDFPLGEPGPVNLTVGNRAYLFSELLSY